MSARSRSQADEQKVVPIPTIAGVAAIVVGLGLVFIGRLGLSPS